MNSLKINVEKLENEAWIFRVFSSLHNKDYVNASCVIEKINSDTCKIKTLSLNDGIDYKQLRPLLKDQIVSLGFVNHTYDRGESKRTIVRKI